MNFISAAYEGHSKLLSHSKVADWLEFYNTQLRAFSSGALLKSFTLAEHAVPLLPNSVRSFWPILPLSLNPVVISGFELCLQPLPKIHSVPFGMAFALTFLLAGLRGQNTLSVEADAAHPEKKIGVSRLRQKKFFFCIWSAILLHILADQTPSSVLFFQIVFRRILLGLKNSSKESDVSEGQKQVLRHIKTFIKREFHFGSSFLDNEHLLVNITDENLFSSVIQLFKIIRSGSEKNVHLNLLLSELEEGLVARFADQRSEILAAPLFCRLLSIKAHLLPRLRLPSLHQIMRNEITKTLEKLQNFGQGLMHHQRTSTRHIPKFYESEIRTCTIALGQHLLDLKSVLRLAPLFLSFQLKAHITKAFLLGPLLEAINDPEGIFEQREAQKLGSLLLYHLCFGSQMVQEPAYLCLRDLAHRVSSHQTARNTTGAALHADTQDSRPPLSSPETGHLFGFLGHRLLRSVEGIMLLARSMMDASMEWKTLTPIIGTLTTKEWRSLVWNAIYQGSGRMLVQLRIACPDSLCPMDIQSLLSSNPVTWRKFMNMVRQKLLEKNEMDKPLRLVDSEPCLVSSAHSVLLGCVSNGHYAMLMHEVFFSAKTNWDRRAIDSTYETRLTQFFLNGLVQCRGAAMIQSVLECFFNTFSERKAINTISTVRFLTVLVLEGRCAPVACVLALSQAIRCSQHELTQSTVSLWCCLTSMLADSSIGPHASLFEALKYLLQKNEKMKRLIGFTFALCVQKLGMEYIPLFTDKLLQLVDSNTFSKGHIPSEKMHEILKTYGMNPNSMFTFFGWIENVIPTVSVKEQSNEAEKSWILSIRNKRNLWSQCCVVAAVEYPRVRDRFVLALRRSLDEAYAEAEQKPDAFTCITYVVCQFMTLLYLYAQGLRGNADIALQEDIQFFLRQLHTQRATLQNLPVPHDTRSALLSRGTLFILDTFTSKTEVRDLHAVAEASEIATEIIAEVEAGTRTDYWMVEHYDDVVTRLHLSNESQSTGKASEKKESFVRFTTKTENFFKQKFDLEAPALGCVETLPSHTEHNDMSYVLQATDDLAIQENIELKEIEEEDIFSYSNKKTVVSPPGSKEKDAPGDNAYGIYDKETPLQTYESLSSSEPVHEHEKLKDTSKKNEFKPSPSPTHASTNKQAKKENSKPILNKHRNSRTLETSSSVESASTNCKTPSFTSSISICRTSDHPSSSSGDKDISEAASQIVPLSSTIIRRAIFQRMKYQNAATILREIGNIPAPSMRSNEVGDIVTTKNCENLGENEEKQSLSTPQHPFAPTLKTLRRNNTLKPYLILLQKATKLQNMNSAIKDFFPLLRQWRKEKNENKPSIPRKVREPHPGADSTTLLPKTRAETELNTRFFVDISPRSQSTTRLRRRTLRETQDSPLSSQKGIKPQRLEDLQGADSIQRPDFKTWKDDVQDYGKKVGGSKYLEQWRPRSISSPARAPRPNVVPRMDEDDICLEPLTQPSPTRLPQLRHKVPSKTPEQEDDPFATLSLTPQTENWTSSIYST